jgi:PAS domain-containing protein
VGFRRAGCGSSGFVTAGLAAQQQQFAQQIDLLLLFRHGDIEVFEQVFGQAELHTRSVSLRWVSSGKDMVACEEIAGNPDSLLHLGLHDRPRTVKLPHDLCAWRPLNRVQREEMRVNLPVTQKQYTMADGTMLVSTTDVQGRITHCNRAFAEVSGFASDDLLLLPHNRDPCPHASGGLHDRRGARSGVVANAARMVTTTGSSPMSCP